MMTSIHYAVHWCEGRIRRTLKSDRREPCIAAAQQLNRHLAITDIEVRNVDTGESLVWQDPGCFNPRMTEAMLDPGRAIAFALRIDDHAEVREFLRAWNEGNTEEWPEYKGSAYDKPEEVCF